MTLVKYLIPSGGIKNKNKLGTNLALNKSALKLTFLVFFKGALSGLRQFLATESPLKLMKNAFVFHLKSSFRSQVI